MQKLLKILFSVLLFVALILGIALLFAFTPTGNSLLEPHLKQRLEERTGLAVEIKAFKMALHEVNLTLLLDNRITLDALSDEGIAMLGNIFSEKKQINFRGSSSSLGGEVAYKFQENVLYTVLTDVPLVNILRLLEYKESFLGETYGKGWYDVKQKYGVLDLDIHSFQIKPTRLTETITMLLGTDPTRIIFSSTKLHAVIDDKVLTYTLLASGTSSTISIRDGTFNRSTKQHHARFTLVYEKYTLHGTIKGSAKNPEVTFDTQTLLKEQLSGGKLQEKLEKALGGTAGKLLRGLSF
ncbi:MAG: hypothetical protein U9O64_11125 [Campylobacterota bacterium]|nr:hypothetical protein [Campylobacterota bacterium]